jgi:hypothetical protein
MEIDANTRNAGDTGFGLAITNLGTANPTGGVKIFPAIWLTNGGKKFTTGLLCDVAAFSYNGVSSSGDCVGIYPQASGSSQTSNYLSFYSTDSGGTQRAYSVYTTAANPAVLTTTGPESVGGAFTASGAVNLTGLTNAATGDYVCYNAGLIEFNAATCTLSLRKYKMDVAPLLGSLNEVMRLKPVEYRYKPDLKLGNRMQVGLIADDVAKVDPRIAAYKDNGELESVDYEHMTAVLVSAIQEQQREIAGLKKEVSKLRHAKP